MKRRDDRVIIHFDYDCFYASVFEVENPALKGLPLCVQQKQIVVTCNYEARRRGLHKLQLIRDAKRICPDAVIVLGEDLTKFRDASKALYRFLRAYSWNGRVETLGFDEVFLDVTDIVEYNIALLSHNNLRHSFFCLRRPDPTEGFAFDASNIAGHAYPPGHHGSTLANDAGNALLLRLILGSHLAWHIRTQMEQQMGYTCTVGISTSKLLSKLVGNVNKPRSQTTLLPPYETDDNAGGSNVTRFMDAHDVGKVPEIGFKMSHKLREYALKRSGKVDLDNTQSDQNMRVTVGDLRALPGVDARVLENVLAGPGMPRDVGFKTWCLMHGIHDAEVSLAKDTPKQISIEDSYRRMNTFEDVRHELTVLSQSLIRRMRADLTERTSAEEDQDQSQLGRWLVHPKTLRLSTRPRPPHGADERRSRTSTRISRSTALPSFVFSFSDTVEYLAERVVEECLIALFRQLHPEKQGWDLSLINVAVVNMVEAAGSSKAAVGQDIGKMFKTQEKNLLSWKVGDVHTLPEDHVDPMLIDEGLTPGDRVGWEAPANGSEDALPLSQATQASDIVNSWYESDEDYQASSAVRCPLCGAGMPDFAIAAHLRFHETED